MRMVGMGMGLSRRARPNHHKRQQSHQADGGVDDKGDQMTVKLGL